jgi:hypothetical protein
VGVPSSTPPRRQPQARPCTNGPSRKRAVLAWLTDLAERADAPAPDLLARSLTLLLDGALADGALSADPAAALAAKQAARGLVDASLSQSA